MKNLDTITWILSFFRENEHAWPKKKKKKTKKTPTIFANRNESYLLLALNAPITRRSVEPEAWKSVIWKRALFPKKTTSSRRSASQLWCFDKQIAEFEINFHYHNGDNRYIWVSNTMSLKRNRSAAESAEREVEVFEWHKSVPLVSDAEGSRTLCCSETCEQM